jgi:hypothetical protein
MILDEKDKPSDVIYIPTPSTPSTHSLTKPKSRLEQKRKLVAQKASTSFFFIHNPFKPFPTQTRNNNNSKLCVVAFQACGICVRVRSVGLNIAS